ncbi:MAG: hypothetical protein AAFZ09_15785, partial [Pseudomonadota bacterium]
DAATGLDVANASPVEHRQLANLRSVIEANGGLAPEADAATVEAHRQAGVAMASLADSDRRIDTVIRVAEDWSRNPGTGLQSAVMAAHDGIRDYDRARFSAEAKDGFATITAARDILLAMRDGLDADSKEAAPIFVTPVGTDPDAALAATKLRTALVGAGYRVVDNREASALTFEVALVAEDIQNFTLGGISGVTSKVTLSLTGAWTYRDEAFLRETETGTGKSVSRGSVTEDAIENTVELLVEALEAKVAE